MPTPDQDDINPQTRTIQLSAEELDGGGGCRLSGLEGIVQILGDDLRALDVEDSPRLEALDLSGCRDDLRLHFSELPALRWVQLPEGEAGATVELALPPDFTPISPLVLDGPIADFGVCAPWLTQSWRLDRPVGKRPVKGLAISPPLANPPSRGVAAHLVVGRGCRTETLTMDCRGIAHLLIMGARMQSLELRNASLDRLQISECPELERIDGKFQARTARINICKRLRSIGGTGRELEVAVVQSPRLSLQGRWLKTHVALSDCRTLELRATTRLKLESLPMLVEIDTDAEYEVSFEAGMFGPNQLAFDLAQSPGELTKLFEREKRDFGRRSKLSTHWIRHLALGNRSLHLPGALSALREISQNGIDREACWLIRCQIAAHRPGDGGGSFRPEHAFRRGSSRWDWSQRLHHDLELWLDDLTLYCLCADLEVTSPFRRTLGRLDQLRQAVVLATALADQDRTDIRRVEVLGYLRACLSRLDLPGELGDAPHQRAQNSMQGHLHPNAFWHWRTFKEHIEALIETLGSIDDSTSSHHLADRLSELGNAVLMQDAAYSMFLADMDDWRQVLIAGLDAPGEVPPHVHTRSLKLLLSGEPDLELA